MPWWGWVLVGAGGATVFFMWAMARSAALGDQIGENAWRDHRATDVSQWSEQRWNDEATKIVNELKRTDWRQVDDK